MRQGFSFAAALAAAALIAQAAPAQGPIDQIEEDWELVVGEPDLTAEGPQITTVMTFGDDLSGAFFAFNLNYRGQPDYSAGGLEVVAFEGKRALASATQGSGRLQTASERITWTQSLSRSSEGLHYAIDRGVSSTWGRFGMGERHLAIVVPDTAGDFSGYRPEASVANSGPGWQPNRVVQMRLVEVRYYAQGQLVAVDPEDREVELPQLE